MFLGVSLIFARNETDCGGFKTWIKGSIGFYIADLILCMNQLMHIKKRRGENNLHLLIMYLILLANTGWYIYGNVIFF